MQKGPPLPVWQVRIHPAREEDAEHLDVFEEVAVAPGHNRRHADAGVQQAQQQILLSSRAYGREYPAAAEFRRTWVFRHAPHDFVVLIQPDEVIRIERASSRHEQRPQFGSSRCVDGIARRVHMAVGIGAVRQQQLHHLAVTGARGGMQGSALAGVGFGPIGIGPAIQQQTCDLAVAEFDCRG